METNKGQPKPTGDLSFDSNKPLNQSFNNIPIKEMKKQVEYIDLGMWLILSFLTKK